MDRQIDTVKPLTPKWRIESFARLDSDQTAVEALQEAETEVGAAEWSASGTLKGDGKSNG